MEPTRRFDDREIALIFERAGHLQESTQANPGNEGLTLAQLQEIARDVGIAPEHVAQAAHAVARGELAPSRSPRWLGLPVAVSRVVEFEHPVSDVAWAQLVGSMRETFDARGRLESDGVSRMWSNGNLRAVLEPTERGHRLRLSTRKGSARSLVSVGVGYLAGSGVLALLGVTGVMASNAATPAAAIFAACGAAFLAATALSLPRWARTRASQMESIAAQAGRLVAPGETGRPVISSS
jgi:hypothetical protein